MVCLSSHYIIEIKGVNSSSTIEKKGDPKFAGISTEVAENKDRKKRARKLLQNLLKPNKLYEFLQKCLKSKNLMRRCTDPARQCKLKIPRFKRVAPRAITAFCFPSCANFLHLRCRLFTPQAAAIPTCTRAYLLHPHGDARAFLTGVRKDAAFSGGFGRRLRREYPLSGITSLAGGNAHVAGEMQRPRRFDGGKATALPMFSTLGVSTESRNRRRISFIYGLLTEVLLIAAAVHLGASGSHPLPALRQHYTLTWISSAAPPPAPKLALDLPRRVSRVIVPRTHLPVPVKPVEVPAPVVARLAPPRVDPTVPPLPISVVPAPAPKIMQAAPPKVQIAVHTGTFGGGAPQPVATRRPVEQVQTGAFGSPQGLPGRALGDSAGNVPKLGSFGLPAGTGEGNGTGGAHGVQSVVASAGFGNGVAGAGYRQGRGESPEPVSVGQFARTVEVARPDEMSLPAPPTEFQPVEILSKPAPVYTPEATRLGIQGDVVLSVIFQASGAVRVLTVVRALGYGLDQAAIAAATRIRFKPAQRAGQPADFPATLHIQFRLANRSS